MVKTQGNCLSISPQPDKICLEVSLHLTFRILLKGLSMHPFKGLSMHPFKGLSMHTFKGLSVS